MQTDSKILLCQYRYDALNRLVANTPSAQADTQRFYLRDRLATEIKGADQRSIMQHDDQLLAQLQRQSGTVETRLFATDQQRSVLNVLAAARRNPLAYTPYGHRQPQYDLLSLLGFNGERPDAVTGCYLLGNGYRAFNPVLMRFNSPDSLSPFGRGGLNAYAYCSGDPRNRRDTTGHFSFSIFPKGYNPIKGLKKMFGFGTPSDHNELSRRGSVQTNSNATSTARAPAEQKTKDEIIASQQRTIASQQKNIDAAETTIELGKSVVNDYRRMISQQQSLIKKQQMLIADLEEDLYFSIYTNPNSTRTPADIAATYGSLSPSPQSRRTPLLNSRSENAAIRNT